MYAMIMYTGNPRPEKKTELRHSNYSGVRVKLDVNVRRCGLLFPNRLYDSDLDATPGGALDDTLPYSTSGKGLKSLVKPDTVSRAGRNRAM